MATLSRRAVLVAVAATAVSVLVLALSGAWRDQVLLRAPDLALDTADEIGDAASNAWRFAMDTVGLGEDNDRAPIDWNAREAAAYASEQCVASRAARAALQAAPSNATAAASSSFSTHWIVVTSINPPTAAVAKLAALDGWRVVVVGDRKTPADWAHANCVFLSLADQHALGYRILAHVPEASYARKNIGYLYAIAHGAEVIYETDDDNLLTEPRLTLWAGSSRTVRLAASPSVDRHAVYNVYAHFGQPTVWPRGYPLDAVADGPGGDPAETVVTAGADAVVGIEQGLADGDPDVDAIFRLTRKNRESPIDIAFARDHRPLVLPAMVFSPFNSQNTAFHRMALWATLIPVTTTFRVCDIWRGYWAQRLLWEAGATLLFREPNVRQDRNVHDYHKDFLDELDLYKDAGRLVDFLRKWRPPVASDGAVATSDHLFERIDALTMAMADESFWGEGDVRLVRAWLQDLLDVCYVPPRPVPVGEGPPAAPAVPAVIAPFAAPLADAERPGTADSTPSPAGVAEAAAAAVTPPLPRTNGLPTTMLGCGNACALTTQVPVYVWDDVVFYTITFPGRHRMMRVARRTWGKHVPRLVVFTSDHDDPFVPTTLLPDPHPSWQARDHRQSAYVNEAVPRLLALKPPAKFFIYIDGDTLPVLPNIHAWLARYKAAHNGSYPYYVLHTMQTGYDTVVYAEQDAEAKRVFTGLDGQFPLGHMYAYSRDLLEELLPVYHWCPVMHPGDANFGALVACSRLNMTHAEIGERRQRAVAPGFVRPPRAAAVSSFTATSDVDDPAASFFFHGIRTDSELLQAYRDVYGRFYGVPDDPSLPRILAGGDG